ncbi:serine-palmitoyl-CoA transferase [Trypanosoma theileri]|uniref:serine C-palmitoyltransferase n=1 Tax=Trypanosoma theileri TaxID=67003 RepID=A0A1X0PAD7_9TRYP|nr:serine-palmitoyl-CoA transferase [Trypanosoma theileri]ORC93785.1 serine-palmitoyl-CoA transferase [Trypanosoma theileri]
MTGTGYFSTILTQIVEHPFHILLEILFTALVGFLLFQRQSKRRKNNSNASIVKMPSEEEQERRIAQFQSQLFRADAKMSANTVVPNRLGMTEVESREGCYITIKDSTGDGVKRCLDLVTEDFHSFSTHPAIVEVARNTVMAYGVGSCGPRGFYGTIKPHMVAEADIAKFLGVEDSIIYSFSFATISTLISAFVSKGEYIVMDAGVNLSVADGCTLSRANVYKYRHNDMTHLETLLKEIVEKEKKENKLSRRFVVTEGIFRNTGDICNLPKILQLCQTYKFRIILEDSYGFGCLGSTARGTHEHYGIPAKMIDVYVGSLSTSLGGVGGFCAGDHAMVDYQRLTAAAYVFSASLPPYVTSAVSAALDILNKDHSYSQRVQANARLFRESLRQAKFNPEKISMIECEGDVSPIILLRPSKQYVKDHSQTVEEELEQIVQIAREKNVLLGRSLYNEEEKCENHPGVRILVKGKASKDELENAATVVIEAVKTAFP